MIKIQLTQNLSESALLTSMCELGSGYFFAFSVQNRVDGRQYWEHDTNTCSMFMLRLQSALLIIKGLIIPILTHVGTHAYSL